MKRDYDNLTLKANELNEHFLTIKKIMSDLEINYTKISLSTNWNSEGKYYFQSKKEIMSNNITAFHNRILEINNYLDGIRVTYYRRKKADEELWASIHKLM